jgi:DNA repair exonuclease SbcCD ATPase subunit
VGSDKRLKPSPIAGMIGLTSGAIFGIALTGLYLASTGYQLAVIQQHLNEQVQKHTTVRELVNDPRFKRIMSGDDATTKLILASASSLENESSPGDLESSFANLEKRKNSVDAINTPSLEQVVSGYHSWQMSKQSAAQAAQHLADLTSDRIKMLDQYKLLIEDVQTIFQTKVADPNEVEAEINIDDPFNLYSKGLLAGIPRVRGVPDDIKDEHQVLALLKQPVDTAEPPSVKVERIRQTMVELSARYDQISEQVDQAEEEAKSLAERTDELKSELRLSLFNLLAESHRSGLDNGAIRVYQEVRRLGA